MSEAALLPQYQKWNRTYSSVPVTDVLLSVTKRVSHLYPVHKDIGDEGLQTGSTSSHGLNVVKEHRFQVSAPSLVLFLLLPSC